MGWCGEGRGVSTGRDLRKWGGYVSPWTGAMVVEEEEGRSSVAV